MVDSKTSCSFKQRHVCNVRDACSPLWAVGSRGEQSEG